jgi:hypothetical protein
MSSKYSVDTINTKNIELNNTTNKINILSSELMTVPAYFVFPPNIGVNGDYLATDGTGKSSWRTLPGSLPPIISVSDLANSSSTATKILSTNINFVSSNNSLFVISGSDPVLLTVPIGKVILVEVSTYINTVSTASGNSNFFFELVDDSNDVVFLKGGASAGSTGSGSVNVTDVEFVSRWVITPGVSVRQYYFQYYNSASTTSTMSNILISATVLN